jgi:hypothetical protein
VAVAVGAAVAVAVGAAVAVAVGAAVAVEVGVAVDVAVAVAVGVAVDVAVAVAVGVAVGVPPAGVDVGVGVAVGPARAGVAVIKATLRARKIELKIFVRGIFSPSFRFAHTLVGHRRFVARIRTNGSAHIIRARPTKREAKNMDSINLATGI